MRCPDITDSAAINPIFNISSIINEGGEIDYPFYWTSTTHIKYPNNGESSIYVAFGRALGYMFSQWLDVHGAGAQRSDPKIGDPDDYPQGRGPQGDAVRIFNYVRCVRGGLSNNQPPIQPEKPIGEASGKSGIEYTYSTSSNDPDDEWLYYWFEWDDETNSEWIGPYKSSEQCNATHIWSSSGNYEIKAKAKDESGAQSEWSDSLIVTMPKINNLLELFLKLFDNYPIINYFIQNLQTI